MNLESEPTDIFVRGQLELCKGQAIPAIPTQASPDALVDHCFRELTRSEFRRTRLDDESAADVRSKLARAIEIGQPVAFSVPFGGYKHFRSKSFPRPDWAEVFTLNYLARYLEPLAFTYEPGVAVHFSYFTGVMEIVSNLPNSAQVEYLTRFNDLLRIFSSFRENLQFHMVDIASMYEEGEMMNELHRNYEENVRKWSNGFETADRERHEASARRNLVPNGKVDLTGLNPGEWDARCVDAAKWCEALDRLTLRREFNKHKEKIQLVFVRGPSKSIHIGSCETSAHHFWAGTGVAASVRGRIRQRILSVDKLEVLRSRNCVEVYDVPQDFQLRSMSDDYSKIALIFE